jgi:hypothetical protein
MTSDINGTVVGIQGNPVAEETLGSSQDGYALTWQNGDGYWAARPAQTSVFTPMHGYQYTQNKNVTYSGGQLGTWVQFAFDNTGASSNTSYSSNSIITNVSGTVRVSAGVATNNGTSWIGGMAIYKNGSLFGISMGNPSAGLYMGLYTLEIIADCAPSDTFSVYVYVGNSGNFMYSSAYMTLTAC